MKIIHALKRIKHIDRKIKTVRERIEKYASILVPITPDDAEKTDQVYQEADIRKMHQRIGSWLDERADLRSRLHVANVTSKAVFQGAVYSLDTLIQRKTVTLPGVIETLTQMKRKKEDRYREDKPTLRCVLLYNPKDRDELIEKIRSEIDELDTILDVATLETEIPDKA